ncbi:hypothetical protein Ahy_B08g093194 [Arachis hypogaea]|uniref:Transposase MuDR plant domain-containing protein n=1 Tax=Arachis hypogaea TaxID=3818 RepID=A0A444Y5J7_ARAHY|nr:hypothetical protein Ahy_B08g093194 [Arachis hypogaea]
MWGGQEGICWIGMRNESPNVVHGAGDNDEPIVEELDSDIDKPYQKPKFHEFDDDTGYGEVNFEVGEMFDTMAQFKQAFKDMFVFEGKELEYIKNEKHRVRAKCAEEGCLWLILTSWNSQKLCFQIKTYVKEHTCGRNLTSNMASRSWVTSKLVKRLLTQPQLSPKEALEHMKEDYNAPRKPIIEADGELSNSYESAEDSLYKPHLPPGFSESSTKSEIKTSKKRKKQGSFFGDSWKSDELRTPPNYDNEADPVVNLIFNDVVKFGYVRLELWMKFTTRKAFKRVVTNYTLEEGRRVRYSKNDATRARVIYRNEQCPWLIYCSYNKMHAC